LKSLWNVPEILPGTSWVWPGSPQVPEEVPDILGMFPRASQVPETPEQQVCVFFCWGGVRMGSYIVILLFLISTVHFATIHRSDFWDGQF
jgi:hypothetical protein